MLEKMKFTIFALIFIFMDTIDANDINSSLLTSKIVGGRYIYPNTMKYMASLKKMSGFHFCGGCLISETQVLTAAHCIHPFLNKKSPLYDGIFLRIGSMSTCDDGIAHIVKRLKVHPQYKSDRTLEHINDIGIVTLLYKVKKTKHVAVIPLGREDVPVLTEVITGGWGSERIIEKENETCQYSDFLKGIQLLVLETKVCESIFNRKVLPSHLCMEPTSEYNTISNGDSGSPLIHNGRVIGIAVKAKPVKGIPIVFTRIFSFLPYLDGILKKRINSINYCK